MTRVKLLNTTSIIIGAFIAIITAGLPAFGAEHGEIAELFMDSIHLEVKAFESPAFNGIVAEQVYDLEYTILRYGENRRGPGFKDRVYKSGDKLVRIFDPGSDVRLDYFDELLDPEFRLTEKSAADFQAFLKTLMPERFFDESEIKGEAVRHEGNSFYFLTGTFFDNLKGFEVKTDGNGKISDVMYDLELFGTE